MAPQSTKTLMFCGVTLCLALVNPARAVDGVQLIDQAHALAGGVTPGDTPGFPVTISLPGTYKLSSNLVVPNENTTAIQITSDSVTIDLNGFSILGPVSCPSDGLHATPGCTVNGVPLVSASGIGVDSATFAKLNTRVVNGTINGMGQAGVYLYVNSRVESINITSNGVYGIYTFGGVIRDTLVRANGQIGILSSGVLMVNSRSIFNGGVGVQTGNVSYLNGNVVALNGGLGLNITANTRYTDNNLDSNNGGGVQISGGTSGGTNTCNGAPCP
jgi:hypothetical protein